MNKQDLNYTPRFTDDDLSQLELESLINAQEKLEDLEKRSVALDLLYDMAEGTKNKGKRERMLSFIREKRKSIKHLPVNTFTSGDSDDPVDFGRGDMRGTCAGEGAYRRGRNPGSAEIAYDGWGGTYINRK